MAPDSCGSGAGGEHLLGEQHEHAHGGVTTDSDHDDCYLVEEFGEPYKAGCRDSHCCDHESRSVFRVNVSDRESRSTVDINVNAIHYDLLNPYNSAGNFSDALTKEYLGDFEKRLHALQNECEDAVRYINFVVNVSDKIIPPAVKDDVLDRIAQTVSNIDKKQDDMTEELKLVNTNVSRLAVRVENTEYKLGLVPRMRPPSSLSIQPSGGKWLWI